VRRIGAVCQILGVAPFVALSPSANIVSKRPSGRLQRNRVRVFGALDQKIFQKKLAVAI
jgi:hypothetical protein